MQSKANWVRLNYIIVMEEFDQDAYDDSSKVLISHPKMKLPVTVRCRVQTIFLGC